MGFKIALLGLMCIAHVKGNAVNCNEKQIIVDLHNSLRMKVARGEIEGQPMASNMQMMVWDDALAQEAQHWANQMNGQHSEDRYDSRFVVGENIAVTSSEDPCTASDWNEVIRMWFGEHDDYKFQPAGENMDVTNDYTQIVWADTEYVGCGYKTYKEDGYLNKYYVCHYGPSGNLKNRTPYAVGGGCENLCCKSQCVKIYGDRC